MSAFFQYQLPTVKPDEPKKLGSKFYFELKLGQSGKVFKAMAKVIRVLHKPNPKIGEPAGMAVVFINVTEEDRVLLRNFLEHNKMSDSANRD